MEKEPPLNHEKQVTFIHVVAVFTNWLQKLHCLTLWLFYDLKESDSAVFFETPAPTPEHLETVDPIPKFS